MGADTKIEWANHTWNPWRGCEHAVLPDGTRHPGCDHCYAEAMSKRNPSVLGEWGAVGKRIRAADDYWKLPLKWNAQAERAGERRRVFCASLADVFEDWQGPILNHNGERLYRGAGAYSAKKFRMTGERRFPASMNDLRRDLFRLIDATPNLDWLLLTKRPENVERMWPDMDCEHCGEVTCGVHRAGVLDRRYRPNVWLGCSVSDQATYDQFAHALYHRCRDLAPVLFLSLEPLLGPIKMWHEYDGHKVRNWQGCFDWIIVGGESGPHARPCNIAWIRSIRDQCKAAEVPCFIKQLGSRPIEGGDFAAKTGPVCSVQLHDKKGGDWNEWPEDLRVRELPEATVPAQSAAGA